MTIAKTAMSALETQLAAEKSAMSEVETKLSIVSAESRESKEKVLELEGTAIALQAEVRSLTVLMI